MIVGQVVEVDRADHLFQNRAASWTLYRQRGQIVAHVDDLCIQAESHILKPASVRIGRCHAEVVRAQA